MSRACPNGHPVEDDGARLCPACGSLLVPAEAAAAAQARGGGDEIPRRDPGRISPQALGILLAIAAIVVGIVAAIIMLNATGPIGGPAL
jgi:hypothetical protein